MEEVKPGLDHSSHRGLKDESTGLSLNIDLGQWVWGVPKESQIIR